MAISESSLGKQILEKINDHDRLNSKLLLKIKILNVLVFVILFAIGDKFNELVICAIAFVVFFLSSRIVRNLLLLNNPIKKFLNSSSTALRSK